MWDQWAQVTAQTVLLEREEALRDATRRFGRREEYAYSEEAVEAMQPGRQRLLMFEKCRARMLRANGQARTQKGHGHPHELRADPPLQRHARHDALTHVWKRHSGLPEGHSICKRSGPKRRRRVHQGGHYPGTTVGQDLDPDDGGRIALLSQPSGNVLNYNMVQSQALQWQNEVMSRCKLLENDPDFMHTIDNMHKGKYVVFNRTGTVKGNNTTLFVFGNARDERNAQNLRSTGNNALLVCMDEGLFFCQGAYKVGFSFIFPPLAHAHVIIRGWFRGGRQKRKQGGHCHGGASRFGTKTDHR